MKESLVIQNNSDSFFISCEQEQAIALLICYIIFNKHHL